MPIYRFFNVSMLSYTIRLVMLKYSDNRISKRGAGFSLTEVIMENYKFIGEWLKERGLELQPKFSCKLREICREFKKTPA